MRILNDNYFTYRQTPVDYNGIAKIDTLRGNSIAWNQLVEHGNMDSGWFASNSTINSYSSGVLSFTASAQGGLVRPSEQQSIISGHKYFGTIDVKVTTAFKGKVNFTGRDYLEPNFTTSWQTFSMVFSNTVTELNYYPRVYDTRASGWDAIQIRNCMLIDLTQMGLDTITSPSQFTDLYPLPYYSYTLGTLVSFNGSGIKTTGKNLIKWSNASGSNNGVVYKLEDQKVVLNGQATSSYSLADFNTSFTFKKGVTYYISGASNGSASTYYVQIVDNPITQELFQVFGDGISFTPTKDTDTFIRPRVINGTSFTNTEIELQIEFGSKTDYEPYTEKSASIPILSYFPTGMKSAGNVYDEISNGKAITRIGAVDLGSLTWTRNTTQTVGVYRFVSSTIPNDAKLPSNNGVVVYTNSIYSSDSIDREYNGVASNMSIGVSAQGALQARNDAYADASAFTSAMNGVYLFYELSTYTEAEFKEDMSYFFFDKGTEQIVPVNLSSPSTTPLLADIIYYDTREGETPYRKFWLINTKGDRWNLTERDFKSFLNNPQNLGYSKTLTVNRYGNVQNLVDVTDNFPQPSGEIIFYDSANSSRYEKYNRLIDFLSYYPITLYYQLPFTFFSQIPNIYTLECVAVSLGKTESKANKMLTCPITFNGLSFYKGDTVEINGSGDTYTLTNNGDFPVGFEITVKGSLTNPYFTLEQDGELYGEAKFTDSTAFGEVYVDSIDGEQNAILKQGGSVLPNPLAYQDLSISNGAIYVTFVKLARGKSTLTVGMDSGSITSVDISFTPIYRSV